MLTVTPTAGNPPRNIVSLDTGDDATVVSSVSVTRDGAELLAQPVAGFRQSAVDDYTAPLGKACTYRAQGQLQKTTGETVLWTENWASTSSWLGSGWTVSSGVASSVSAATIVRNASGFARVTVANPSWVKLEVLDAAGNVLVSVVSSTQTVLSGGSSQAVSAVGSYSLSFGDGVARLMVGSQNLAVAFGGVPDSVRLGAYQHPVSPQLVHSGRSLYVATDASTMYVAESQHRETWGICVYKYTRSGTLQGGYTWTQQWSSFIEAQAYGDSYPPIVTGMTLSGSTLTMSIRYDNGDYGTQVLCTTDGVISLGSSKNKVPNTTSYDFGGGYKFNYSSGVVASYPAWFQGSVGQIVAFKAPVVSYQDFEESVTVTLDSEDAWIVHPRQPSLSVRMPKGYSTSGFVTVGDRSQESKATSHTVLGSRLPVVTRFGTGRSAPTFGSVTLATGTQEEAASMDALLQDETPLFFNIPDSWRARLATAFYQVTSVQDSAKVEFASDWRLLWTLALQQVREPKTVVVPTWNWGSVALGYSSWKDVQNAYATWYDLLIDNRRS